MFRPEAYRSIHVVLLWFEARVKISASRSGARGLLYNRASPIGSGSYYLYVSGFSPRWAKNQKHKNIKYLAAAGYISR
jgi:hypothetical protein